MRKVSFDELMQAVDFMTANQYAFGDEIPEDMEYNGFVISFRDSNQFHQAVVRAADSSGGTYVYYDDNLPMTIQSHGRNYTPRQYFAAYVNDEFNTLHPAAPDPRVYGYVNGKPVYSREEYSYTARGFGPFESDDALLAYAEKATYGWSDAGWHRTFTTYYIDGMDTWTAIKFTPDELKRLKEMQAAARAAEKAADDARLWHKVETVYWADNSVEEIWEDKDGVRKTVMVDGPHGDACY